MAAPVEPAFNEPAGPAVDRCPYSRSFTAEFAENPICPAYQGAIVTVLDTAHRPLNAALTCRHLTVGADSRRAGRFYPRCGLGGPAERLSWVATVTPARLAVMRSLEEEFDVATLGDRELLLAAKAAALGAAADPAAITALESRLSAFLALVDAFIDERSDRLSDVGLRASQLKQLVAEWSMAWLRSRQVVPRLARAQLRAIAPDTAAFLGADLGEDIPSVPPAAPVVAEAGALVVERSEQPLVLRLRGEIDVSNSDAVSTAVTGALQEAGDVFVDFHGVLFCDLSGLRALVRAAETVADGQQIRVSGLPAYLHRALRLVGWSDLPGLVVEDAEGPPTDERDDVRAPILGT